MSTLRLTTKHASCHAWDSSEPTIRKARPLKFAPGYAGPCKTSTRTQVKIMPHLLRSSEHCLLISALGLYLAFAPLTSRRALSFAMKLPTPLPSVSLNMTESLFSFRFVLRTLIRTSSRSFGPNSLFNRRKPEASGKENRCCEIAQLVHHVESSLDSASVRQRWAPQSQPQQSWLGARRCKLLIPVRWCTVLSSKHVAGFSLGSSCGPKLDSTKKCARLCLRHFV